MRGLSHEHVGPKGGDETSAGRVLQCDIHGHVVGEDAIAQSLHGLVVVDDLGLLHVLGADVVGELVVVALAQV